MCNVCYIRTTCLLTLGQFKPKEDRALIAECIAIEMAYDRRVEVKVFGYSDAHQTEIIEKANELLRRTDESEAYLDQEKDFGHVK